MSSVPIKYNAVTISILAIISALGIITRVFIRFSLFIGFVEITPGFVFSLLGGIIGGLPGGILVGAVVGIGGALAAAEPPILPLIGNICLGIGTGWVIHAKSNRESMSYYLMVIISGGLIGGFIPSLVIFALTESMDIALIWAIADCIQACFWAIVALFINKMVILPLAGHYLYPTGELYHLDNLEEDEV
jgi:hypothetical protein